MDWLIPGIVGVVLLGGIVVLNVYDYRRRAKLSPEERAAEDEEVRREMQIW